MTKIRIGNVPEHFSSPLHIAAKRGIFKKHLVDVELVNCPGGTGEMVKMLQSQELEVTIALTEGLVAAIAKNPGVFSIVGTYVDAPLTWAISVGQNSTHQSVDDLRGGVIGISRFGSGSHIMSYVLGDEKGWLNEDTCCSSDESGSDSGSEGGDSFTFCPLKDFKGLRDGVNSGIADAFMWEQFTTKPYYDSQEVRRIGHITTPWPAFLIAVRNDILDKDHEMINRLLVAITEACKIFIKEKETGQSIEYVSKTYGQKEEDVQAWFKTVKYADSCSNVSQLVLKNCVQTLQKAKVLNTNTEPFELIDQRVAELIV